MIMGGVESRLSRQVLNALANYFFRQEDIAAVYLFGSYARGTDRESSDIDLAVLFSAAVENKMQRFDRRMEMMIDLEKITGMKVDVIDILAAPLLLQHQVLKYGQLLVDKNPAGRIAFEVCSRRTYLDFKPHLERRNRSILAGIVESGLNGG